MALRASFKRGYLYSRAAEKVHSRKLKDSSAGERARESLRGSPPISRGFQQGPSLVLTVSSNAYHPYLSSYWQPYGSCRRQSAGTSRSSMTPFTTFPCEPGGSATR